METRVHRRRGPGGPGRGHHRELPGHRDLPPGAAGQRPGEVEDAALEAEGRRDGERRDAGAPEAVDGEAAPDRGGAEGAAGGGDEPGAVGAQGQVEEAGEGPRPRVVEARGEIELAASGEGHGAGGVQGHPVAGEVEGGEVGGGAGDLPLGPEGQGVGDGRREAGGATDGGEVELDGAPGRGEARAPEGQAAAHRPGKPPAVHEGRGQVAQRQVREGRLQAPGGPVRLEAEAATRREPAPARLEVQAVHGDRSVLEGPGEGQGLEGPAGDLEAAAAHRAPDPRRRQRTPEGARHRQAP